MKTDKPSRLRRILRWIFRSGVIPGIGFFACLYTVLTARPTTDRELVAYLMVVVLCLVCGLAGYIQVMAYED